MVTCNVFSSYTRTATDWGDSGRVVEAVLLVVLQPTVVHVSTLIDLALDEAFGAARSTTISSLLLVVMDVVMLVSRVYNL